MGKLYEEITPELAEWIGKQHIFFIATAPLAADGLVNCSPNGMDTFRVLGTRSVAYLDLTGSGIETVAHLNENSRAVIMFCAFAGAPKIVRLHGEGTVITPDETSYPSLKGLFPDYPGARAIIKINVIRISDSCGYAVPFMNYAGERDTLIRASEAKGEEELAKYRIKKNLLSIDGLPGLKSTSP